MTGHLIDTFALSGPPRHTRLDAIDHLWDQRDIGVEQQPHGVLVERRLRRLHEARDAAELLTIEEDVPRRFLRIRSQAGILDDLGRDDRHILDGQMHHSMLCYRGVPVAHDPFLMKLPGFLLGCGKISCLERRSPELCIKVDVTFLNELQQIAPQALPTPAIVCEQHGHDFFGQIFQGVDWPIDVGHVWSKNADFFLSEVTSSYDSRSIKADRLSQRDCFFEYPISDVLVQSLRLYHIYFAPQDVLKIHHQPANIEEAAPRRHIHKKIYIRVRSGVPSRSRAK